ncbi:DNA (cytosine-5-)-methyltransferase [Paenibacillus sp. DXFW5]|uniref:Cytosine-specific methyltransferase n=1 Tax=Paenibacillus rhizolycopersici TaxID=2780073 RepID=A0ABS2H500_9BACL|nr:DNA (cytosine-5-)-methyltransferase [Paenibacillus rhizolycopersici]MBM6995771.1 DNA (cytosine-5-)-methyltransferase [Paenibacillus rhizolycopersici]
MKAFKNTEFAHIREATGYSIKEVARLLGKSERTIYRWENGESVPEIDLLRELTSIYNVRSGQHPESDFNFRFIDLFAGIGGLRKAFESIGGKCVFTSEWDSACRKTYQANYECDHPVNGDIRDVDLENMPPYDVLVAGFPCQPFSIAGVSKKNSLGRPHGFHDATQGTLFFDVAQMIEYHRPKAFLLENVKNLVSHDKGNTFKVIMRTLQEELGYHVDFRVIDAKHYVPQHRERIFIVGFREDVGFDFKDMKIPDTGPRLGSILHQEDGTEAPEPPYTEIPAGRVADKYTLSDRLWEYLQNYAEKHRAKGNGFGYGLFGPEDVARTLSARYYKDGSEILIRQEGKNPRRLTPRECARLMGFDKPGQSMFEIPVSDTQAYKQFGNSVAVPVVEAVAAHMLPFIFKVMRTVKDSDQVEVLFERVEVYV